MNKHTIQSPLGFILTALTLLALLLHAPLAFADDAATEHAKKARVAYDLQDFSLSIKEFRAAYAAEQRPDYLFGLGQAQRQAKDYAGAIASFKAYKRLEAVTPQQGTAAELLITKCEVEQARADVASSSRPDAGNAAGEPAANPPQTAPAGAPTPTPAPAAVPNRQPPVALAPREDAAPHGPRHFYADALGDSLFIAGLGASAVGAFFLVSGNSAMKDSANAATDSAAQRAADSAHGKQVVGAVLLPVGGALLVGSIVRWATTPTSSDDSNTAGLLVGPQYVGYAGKF